MRKQFRLFQLVLVISLTVLCSMSARIFASSNLDIGSKVDILISAKATIQEKKAAEQLNKYLHLIYPSSQFAVTSVFNKNNLTIWMGLLDFLSLDESLVKEIPTQEEGFLIRSQNSKSVTIASRSARGLFNAVYALAEKLGCGFYLSYEGVPMPKKELIFRDWEMTDFPLQNERIVFDWHNFLSGCTGWSYDDWCSWIDQSAKMRYNTIMVHAYGNNPMFGFEYNGLKKEVGYLTTSISGRDWGAQHIMDIRRLPGGEIFADPVFGSETARVPDDQRSEAATRLMSRVFKHANEMAMKINFAIDVDTWSANPKNIIESLPSESRIKLETQYVVNPETVDGYQYYKAQVKSLLKSYPGISTITVWVRSNGTLWRDIKPEQFPKSWQNEWKQVLLKNPEILADKSGASTFAFSKIVVAFQRALKDLKREDVEIAFGSWRWDFLPSASLLIPSKCTLIPLDWSINFETSETQNLLSKVGQSRKLIPIVWAHHDDHRYMGRPYTPYPDFNKMLLERNAAGFGIIHWTTRPLDLFFKSLGDQVWSKTENRKIESTLLTYNQTIFGSKQQPLLDYITEWIERGPMFGRETSDHLFDLGTQKTGDIYEPAEVRMERSKSRMDLLQKVDQSVLSKSGQKCFKYCESMELFYRGIFENQDKFTKVYAMLERHHIDSARVILQTVYPEKTIEAYAKASTILPITSGEKALIISMGTRWLPDFLNLKQRARMTGIYYKFQATQHDPLAQSPGTNTYFVDEKKIFWSCLGEKEMKSGRTGTFSNNEIRELPENSRTYLLINQPLTFPLATIGRNNLEAGKYRLELKYLNSVTNSDDCRLFLKGKNGITLLPLESIISGSKLKVISTRIEINAGEKYDLYIESGSNGKLLTNLIIMPIE